MCCQGEDDCNMVWEKKSCCLIIPGENGSDTNGYRRYHIGFHIFVRIRIRIVSTMPDTIRLDVNIINMRFQYLETDMVSDVEFPD